MKFNQIARWGSAAVLALGLAQGALAAAVMPDFDNAPVGWSVDRYAAASFGDVGTYQGRDNVLGIGIDSSTNAANRGAQSATFYNTQGMKYLISGGAGSVLSADLYIDAAWRDNNNGSGYVRTDMWGTMVDGTAAVSAYPIIGFTNQGGAARLRVWDGDIGWVNLTDAILFDAWNALSIVFTGTSFDYYVNDALLYSYTDTTISGTTQFKEVIMQAYNFNDAALNIAGNADYSVHWSNAVDATVPEPASLALVGAALLGLAASRRRRA